MKIKFSLTVIIILFCAVNLFATAQYPDKIFYKGKEYALHSNPMEEYFKKFPDKRPKSGIISSALWRGYVATFEIADNSLFLKDIEIEVRKKTDNERSFETEWKSVLSEVVPDNRKLKIDWFTGLLVLPYGKVVNYVHMGYGSTYKNYILLEIDRGDFKLAREFTHKQYEKFKERQFQAFKKTEEYKKLIEEMKKDGSYDEKFADSFLRNFVTDYTSKILVD
mgnify:CR=1 FL=1|jgi:hypothetical protein